MGVEWRNLVDMFFRQAEANGDRPFMWEKHDDEFRPMSWAEAAKAVRALAATLRARGLQDGERVVIVAHNSPHWAIADFAIMAAGGVTVPAYTTNTQDNHAHILRDSGATAAIVAGEKLADTVLAATADTDLRHMVVTEAPTQRPEGIEITDWSDAIAEDVPAAEVEQRIAAIDANNLACLIYTSGTGGAPKGVMLSHRAILSNCAGAADILRDLGLGDEVFLSFLPLSHAYEHTAGLMFPVSIGAEIYFAEKVETLTSNLPEARPTIMTAVPRLYHVMHDRILFGLRDQSRLRQRLFWTAVRLGRKRYEDAASMTIGERIADAVVDRLVRNKVRARFGGRLKALVSGGAPLDYEIGVFFTALGLRLLQGYGQTEAAPVISCNRCTHVKLQTVGPPLTDVELKIADDGEILVRGPLLMDGYWNLPKLSADALKDGWLHTGDIGVIDEDGFLQITDRKKDIIVSSGGDTISPLFVEGVVTREPEIEATVVIGDNRPHLVAVVVPSHDFIGDWNKTNHRTDELAALAEDDGFRKAVGGVVDRANKQLPANLRIKRFVVADEPFTVTNGMMTPTMKARRHRVEAKWAEAIDALY